MTILTRLLMAAAFTLLLPLSNTSAAVISILDASADEGDQLFISTMLVDDMNGGGGLLGDVSFSISLADGTATGGPDFTDASPLLGTFPGGSAVGTAFVIAVDILEDFLLEGTEMFTGILSCVQPNDCQVSVAQGEFTIFDDDSVTTPEPSMLALLGLGLVGLGYARKRKV